MYLSCTFLHYKKFNYKNYLNNMIEWIQSPPGWGNLVIKVSHLLLTFSSAANILIYSYKVNRTIYIDIVNVYIQGYPQRKKRLYKIYTINDSIKLVFSLPNHQTSQKKTLFKKYNLIKLRTYHILRVSGRLYSLILCGWPCIVYVYTLWNKGRQLLDSQQLCSVHRYPQGCNARKIIVEVYTSFVLQCNVSGR